MGFVVSDKPGGGWAVLDPEGFVNQVELLGVSCSQCGESDISRMLRMRCLWDFLGGCLGRHSKQKGWSGGQEFVGDCQQRQW